MRASHRQPLLTSNIDLLKTVRTSDQNVIQNFNCTSLNLNSSVAKRDSKVKIMPCERKVVDYVNRSYVTKVPVKRKVIEYQQVAETELVPHERVTTDYYAVERQVHYIKDFVTETKLEYVPKEHKVKRYEYIPVQKQVVHYPECVDETVVEQVSRSTLEQNGFIVSPTAEFKKIDPTLMYELSAREQNRDKPIGYVEQGRFRIFSNAPTTQEDPVAQNIYRSDYPSNFLNNSRSGSIVRETSKSRAKCQQKERNRKEGSSQIRELKKGIIKSSSERPVSVQKKPKLSTGQSKTKLQSSKATAVQQFNQSSFPRVSSMPRFNLPPTANTFRHEAKASNAWTKDSMIGRLLD